MIIDAGGLPLADGGTMVTGQLLRVAGGLVRAGDLPRLEALGVRTYVDLRGGAEDRALLEDWAARAGVVYHWQPIDVVGGADLLTAVQEATDVRDAAVHMVGLYRHMVDVHGRELAATVGAVAEGLPAAFGCLAGKDRTGIVAALLQTLAGVPEDAVADAYVASAPEVDVLAAMLREQFGMTEQDTARPGMAVALGVERATIRATLEHLDDAYGGVERYLVANGLDPAVPPALRAALAGTPR